MKHLQKILICILMALIFVLNALPTLAVDSYVLKTSDYKFDHEYNKIDMPSYIVNGKVYVPLHVFSDYFNIIAKYDVNTQSVYLDIGESTGKNDRVEKLIKFVQDTGRDVKASSHKVYALGKQVDIPMLVIDGYHFLQIDVIAEAYGYRAVADEKAHTIGITQDDLYGIPELPEMEEYLKQNQIAVKTDNLSELKGSDFDKYSIYLVGEQHAIAKNFDIKKFFIQYLNQHQNVKYIISEEGFCDSMLVNKYLQTGDTSIISNILEGTKGSFAYSKEHYDFLKKLYDYNKTLPEDRKLVLIGLDVQHNTKVGTEYILSLFDGKTELPEVVLQATKALKEYSADGVTQAFQLVEKNREIFKKLLGDDFNSFLFGLRSVQQSYAFYEKRDFELREQYIHKNFSDYYKEYKLNKCFGMFGGAHTVLDGTFGNSSNLASYMNNEHSATKGKVCSIMTNYINCSYMDNKSGKSVEVAYNQSTALSRLLDKASNTDLVLFPLDKKDSLFITHGITKSYQYYLCVKNSPAVQPYGDLNDSRE